MAPFKFGKKLHLDLKLNNSFNGNSQNGQALNNGPPASTAPPKPSDLNNSPQQRPGNANGQREMNQTFPSFNRKTSYNDTNEAASKAGDPRSNLQQQRQPMQQPPPQPLQPPLQQPPQQPSQQQQNRIYPTPPPTQQRNFSGAATTLLPKQAEYTPWNRIKLLNSPFPRYRHVSSSYVTKDNKVYVIGGLHDQSVYGDTWIISGNHDGSAFTSKLVEITENTPPPRVGHAATLCGNAFVIFGGDTHKVNKEGLMDDDLYLFNVNTFKWTVPHPVGPRPLGRYGHKISIIATTTMKTKLYLFGGQFDDTYFNDLAVFDLSSFRKSDSHWEFIKIKSFVPPPITNHTMVTYNNKLWVFGGDTQQGLVNDLFAFEPQNNAWSKLETTGPKPPPIQEHSALVYKNLMCVVGGKDENDMYLNSIYFLNLDTLKWFSFPLFKSGIMQGRSGHSMTLLSNDKILIMGGDKYDYALPEENNLHTSETDCGAGTILYTLNLSRLSSICPGVFDSQTENQYESNEGPKDPTTPPTKDSATLGLNGSLPKTPEQGNILTPYQGSATRTPNIVDDSITSQNNESKTNNNNGTLIIHELDESVEQSQNKEPVHVPSAISTPVAAATPASVETSGTPIPNSSLKSHQYSPELNPDKPKSTGTDSVIQSDLSKTDAKSEDLNDSPVAQSNFSANDGNTPAITANDVVNKSQLYELRDMLKALKLETEEKAKEVSDYVQKLEKENESLRGLSGTGNDSEVQLMKVQSDYDLLEADHKTMKDKHLEMEQLLNAKFMDVTALNDVIKQLSEKLEGTKDIATVQKELDGLKLKNDALTHENEHLKQIIEQRSNDTFAKSLEQYSTNLNAFLTTWKKSTNNNSTSEIGSNETIDSAATPVSAHHQQVIGKLSNRLDELLTKCQDLTDSKNKLALKYKNLEDEHTQLSQDLQSKDTMLHTAEENYRKSLSSVSNTSRALELTQAELNKYKSMNGQLKDELEKYKFQLSHSNLEGNDSRDNLATENLKDAQFNLRIRDLKAELIIVNQERDQLKDEVLQMKKKLLTLDNE